jgi:tripartite-type tricarboxylate transporter receptor subunit TctC
MIKHLQTHLVIALAAVLAGFAPASAQDFYEGKQIRLLISTAPGGGYDTYARALPRHTTPYHDARSRIMTPTEPSFGSRR